ncbi:MAG: zinc ribbon domain-containing protein [Gemmatimonadaceae bacterium]|nr:zinc ribbon domain-containing protein [Gloeobacterales cyanobacterium ES-bin-141]
MHTPGATDDAPTTGEGLAAYIRRLRGLRKLTQAALAERAGVHLQTVRKIERGVTATLRPKARGGLARSLGVGIEYIEAAERGVEAVSLTGVKLCPNCWVPGTEPQPMWLDLRSHFCFACGTELLNRCIGCGEAIASWRFRFCPLCGKPYKGQSQATTRA